MSGNLTLNRLKELKAFFESREILIGVVLPLKMYSETKKTIRDLNNSYPNYANPQFLIDSRLSDKAECFYDLELWKKRVEEQNKFDNSSKK